MQFVESINQQCGEVESRVRCALGSQTHLKLNSINEAAVGGNKVSYLTWFSELAHVTDVRVVGI